MRRLQGFPMLFVAGFLLIQCAWVLTVPPFRASDEFDHAYRAAGVASGQWVLSESAENGRGELVEVPASLVKAAAAQCTALKYTGTDNCVPVAYVGEDRAVIATAAGSYNPLFYWIVGTVASPFEGAAALYAMRCAGALMCLSLLAGGAWASRRRGPWPRLAVVLAITPVAAYSTVIGAPNGLEISAGVTLWASLLSLADDESNDRTRALFWMSVASAAILCTLRLLGPFFVVAIVASVGLYARERLWSRLRAHRPRLLTGALLVASTGAGSIWWILYAGQLSSAAVASASAGSTSSVTTAASWGPSTVMLWGFQSIAAFPLRSHPAPIFVYPIVGGLVIALLVAAWRRGQSRDRLASCAIVTAAFLIPATITWLTSASQGAIWQGRYGLPYGVGLVLVAGWLLARARGSDGLRLRLLVPAAGLWSVAICACLIKVRSTEMGRDASRLDPSWWAPAPFLLVGLVVAGSALLAAWISRGQRCAS